MRRPFPSLLVFVLLWTFALLWTFSVRAEEPSKNPPPHWNFGESVLFTITDTVSSMDAGLFTTADKAVLDKYLPNGKAPSTVSTFLWKLPGVSGKPGKTKYVLFDAGFASETMLKNLARAGVSPEDIETVLLTHMHGDHISGLLDGDKPRFPNARVYCVNREYGYWLGKGPDAATGRNRELAEKVAKAYGDRFQGNLEFDKEIATVRNVRNAGDAKPVSLTPLNAVGHTPGHTVFLLESQGERFMVVGDILHAAALQFPVPDACPRYDMDPAEAVKSRRRILDKAVEEQLPVAGMHLPEPCIGFVTRDGNGYKFSPMKDR